MPTFATSSDGLPIAYEVHGSVPPALLFVHGWSCDREYWNAQFAPLSANGLVVAVDLAGHGESGVKRKDFSIAAFGADVAAVAEAVALKDVILVGHSMGADVILEAAVHIKDRVRGLIWIDQHSQLSHFMSEAQVRERMAPFRKDFNKATRAFVRSMFKRSADPSLVERVSSDMASAPQEVALPALEATWNYGRNVPAILSQLKLPLVAINSESSSTDIESMQRHGVEVVLMAEVGHFPMMERPQEFNACLAQVLKRFKRKRERDA